MIQCSAISFLGKGEAMKTGEPKKKREAPWTLISFLLCGIFVVWFGIFNLQKEDSRNQRPAIKAGVSLKLGSWSGSGAKTTEKFESVTGELEFVWDAKQTDNEIEGIFQIYSYGSGGMKIPANQIISGTVAESGFLHGDPGIYYLTINAAHCSWSVDVYERR
jgi:hypothetical protein